MLPMLLRIRVKSDDGNINLFIPLLLVYILLLPAFIIVSVVYALMLISPATEEARRYIKLLFHTPGLLAAAKGTEIDVKSDDGDVRLYIK